MELEKAILEKVQTHHHSSQFIFIVFRLVVIIEWSSTVHKVRGVCGCVFSFAVRSLLCS